MCKIREGPCAASKPFLPPLVFRMCDDTISGNSSKGTCVVVDFQEKSGVDFSKMAARWTQCSPDSHSHFWNHGGTASAEQRRALEEVLYRKNAATICQAVQRYDLVVNKAQTTDRWEVFPASRPAIACEISAGFRQQPHGRLQSETDPGCPVGACAGANVKDSHDSVEHESEWPGAEVRG